MFFPAPCQAVLVVDGVCLAEKGKFGGKSEVLIPMENTGRARILEAVRRGHSSGPCLQIQVDNGREAEVFSEG